MILNQNRIFLIGVIVLLLAVCGVAYIDAKNITGALTADFGVAVISPDRDSDGIIDKNDTLIGQVSWVTTDGIDNLTITVGNASSPNGTFDGMQEVVFYDGALVLLNFTHNFNLTQQFNMEGMIVNVSDNYIFTNMQNQLLSNEYKSLYLTDNDFAKLCAKDAEISAISEMSSECTDADETSFDDCISNSAGITRNNLTCYDNGTITRTDNFKYSALRGTPRTPAPPAPAAAPAGTGPAGISFTTSLASDFIVVPDVIGVTLFRGEAKKITFSVKNTGLKGINITVKQKGLEDLMMLAQKELSIGIGETKTLDANIFVPSGTKPGVYVGTLVFRDSKSGLERSVAVIIEVKEKEALFDISVRIPLEYKWVLPGSNISAEITMDNIGLKGKPVDVGLIIYIMDMNRTKLYQGSKEFLAVETELKLTRHIPVPASTPAGKYVLVGEVVYGNTTAASYDTFDVTSSLLFDPQIMALLVLVALIIFFAYRRRKRKE